MFCKNCGTKNDPDKKFCKSCGTSLNQPIESNEDNLKNEDKKSSTEYVKQTSKLSSYASKSDDTADKEEQQETTDQSKGDASTSERDMLIEEQIQDVSTPVVNPSSNRQSTSKFESPSIKKTPKKITRKTKVLLSLATVIFLLLFGTYKYAENYFSYENQRDRHIETIKTLDAKAYSESLVSNHPGFEVTEESMQPLVEYLSEKSEGYTDVLRHLKSNIYSFSEYDMVYIQQDGKHLGLFDRYQLMVTPVEFYIATNLNDVTFTYGDKEEHVTEDFPMIHVGPVSPGIQHMSVKSTIAGTDVERNHSEEILYLDEGGYIPELFVEVETFSFTVETDVDLANVYLKGQLLGEVTDGEAELGPILWGEDLVAKFETTLESGEVVEKDIILDPNTSYYDVQVFPDVSSYDIENMISRIYSAASELADDESDENPEEVASYLVNGQENDLFSTYKNTGERYRNNEDISGVYYSVYLMDYELVDLTTVNVTYELSVNEYGSDGSSFELDFTGSVKITDDGSYLLESASLIE